MKARVLYDILQDNLQETISALDKDFSKNLNALIFMATKLVYEFEAEVNTMGSLGSPGNERKRMQKVKE
jgi:hypothetical protein